MCLCGDSSSESGHRWVYVASLAQQSLGTIDYLLVESKYGLVSGNGRERGTEAAALCGTEPTINYICKIRTRSSGRLRYRWLVVR